jgi:hypothetical protein
VGCVVTELHPRRRRHNAANTRLLADSDADRSAFLGSVAAQWSQLDPDKYPFVRRATAHLREHDDREQFITGVDISWPASQPCVEEPPRVHHRHQLLGRWYGSRRGWVSCSAGHNSHQRRFSHSASRARPASRSAPGDQVVEEFVQRERIGGRAEIVRNEP